MKYDQRKSTSELGLNYIHKVVIKNNCIFHEFNQKNDIGIDILIEFVKNEIPTGKTISVQVKSGESYFNHNKNECIIPIENHFKYWNNYSLPVFGIVYVPSNDEAYWVDIKKFIKKNKDDIASGKMKTIKYTVSNLNKFTEEDFKKYFIPYIFKTLPNVTYEEANLLFNTHYFSERYVGIKILYEFYSDKIEVWQKFIEFFRESELEDIPSILIYVLSHIPWHGDLFDKGKLTEESTLYAKNLIKQFNINDVEKLLSFIDEDNFIARGTIGQCVEAIVSIIPNKNEFLKEIILDNSKEMFIREAASAIYALYNDKKSISLLEKVNNKESWFINQLIEHLKEFGWFNPYA